MAASTPRIDNLEDPTGLSDELATKLGKKVYSHGTTYNGGNAPTVSGVSSTQVADFIPYQMQDGSWRLKFNIVCAVTGSTGIITVNGVVYANTDQQGLAAATDANAYAKAFTNPNTDDITWQAGNTTAEIRVSGDVALESKPTWAY